MGGTMVTQPELALEKGYSVHGIKPWTVLRADSRDWQTRKRWWLAQGLDDRAGRPDAVIYSGAKTKTHQRISGGGSTFDPVLAEVLVSWYSPRGGTILDPLAGGPTRGIVAATLDRHYTGIDLMESQIAANKAAWQAWPHQTGTAEWAHGDARDILPGLTGPYNYAYSCPPYWRLERYSDDPRDLSAMTLDDFHSAHTTIIHATIALLTDDAFCTWVIGDLRDDTGHLAQLPWRTIEAFGAAGARLVNDQILVTPVGSKYWTLGRTFRATRSCTRLHQYVLTFCKGDRRKAAAKITGGGAQ